MVALAIGPKVETPVAGMAAPFHRFTMVDLYMHGHWLAKRLMMAYPNQTLNSIGTYLRNLSGDNHSLFITTDNAVGLFQVTNVFAMFNTPSVIERFVFAKEGHLAEALDFYDEALKWAASMGIKEVFVEYLTDVPHDVIKDRVGRLYTKQQWFAKV
jgi:hypothetical protein